MSLDDTTLHLCNCNRTMPLDAAALGTALKLRQPIMIRQQMCQAELGEFGRQAGGRMVVASTQESERLRDAAEELGQPVRIEFVNIRETGGWSAEAPHATPKIAALLAAATLPEPEPVPRVRYEFGGHVLVAGPADVALAWAKMLDEHADVTLLLTDTRGATLPQTRAFPTYSGTLKGVTGWLGKFDVEWTQDNPIDLDACTRCNACIAVCPEQAIDFSYQIDLDKCRSHRDCVVACGPVRAIDFERAKAIRSEAFDAVVDLQPAPFFSRDQRFQPPQGYFAPAGLAEQLRVIAELADMGHEYEKPKYFAYKSSICAHSRSRQEGCNQCIDVCSTKAISGDGDLIKVEPHLCMGCGACTTVCPSGALTFQYPQVPGLGVRIKTLLRTYSDAGGRDACLLLHAEEGRDALERLARRGRGLPARVIPVAVHHVASAGMDVWLGALAWGASQVAVLATGAEAPQYREALARQMGYADAIAQALGYQGQHFTVIEGDDTARCEQALWSLERALPVRVPATFNWTPDKRTTVGMAVDHLLQHAPVPQSVIPLSAGAPFGTLAVNHDTCTLCMACVGACPENALADNPEAPQLRFIENNCVQCGICVNTCPEKAITLHPRLNVTKEAKQLRVLNEAPIYNCIGCGKPLGTQKMVEGMIARLAGHSMFAAPEKLNRLRMCADCRVVDLIKTEPSASIDVFKQR